MGRGMVCLVLPGLLFFKTARMQRQAKGLHAPLLRKGARARLLPTRALRLDYKTILYRSTPTDL